MSWRPLLPSPDRTGRRPNGWWTRSSVFATRALASGRLAYSMIAEPTTEAAEALRLVIRAELAELFASIVADGVATGAFDAPEPGDERHRPRRCRLRGADRSARPLPTDDRRARRAARRADAVHDACGRRPVARRARGRPMTVTEPGRRITSELRTDDLVQPGRVNGLAYTDPAVFEAELERIFTGGWVFVGHESEVPARRRLRHPPARARPGDHGPRPRWRRPRDGQPVQPPRCHALPARVGQHRVVRVHLPRLDVRPRRGAARCAATGRHVQRPRARSG